MAKDFYASGRRSGLFYQTFMPARLPAINLERRKARFPIFCRAILMNKLFAALLAFFLVFSTGCGDINNNHPADNKKINLGMISRMNVSETLLDTYFQQASSRMSQTSNLYAPKHIFFDNMSSLIAALNAGQVDRISSYRSVANYLLIRNKNLQIVDTRVPKVSDSFCCALRADETTLKQDFDAAINEMKSDGSLDSLIKTYITDLGDNEPPTVEFPRFDGANTVKIAVTGDLPPLDLISPDGKPAGFNTAMLAAISRRIGKNFELVQVDSGARAAALTSNQVDVVFWVTVPLDNPLSPPDFDKPDGVILTQPYFSDEIAHVALKK